MQTPDNAVAKISSAALMSNPSHEHSSRRGTYAFPHKNSAPLCTSRFVPQHIESTIMWHTQS
jgi:hypothetical protein